MRKKDVEGKRRREREKLKICSMLYKAGVEYCTLRFNRTLSDIVYKVGYQRTVKGYKQHDMAHGADW